ncbi:uncharacterized protein LOC119741890 [Patiria miniata]|uniref:Uncharacterized protein n=1 Tax=Patiria miniata TaxID=46514 RepID=A0A914BC02_PATMI|nr:uncharacterized protein LOC119741890 [Patiria miniata]
MKPGYMYCVCLSWMSTFLIYCTSVAILPTVGATLWPGATNIHTTPSDHSIIVLDNVITEPAAHALHSYVLQFAQWKLNGHAQETSTLINNQTAEQSCLLQKKVPWSAQLSSPFYENVCFLKNILSLPELVNFTPHSVQAEILRRGDSIKVQCGLDKQGLDTEYSWRVFLTPDWQINDYGDLMFYDRNDKGGKQEAVLTVHPRMGRFVLWDSSLSFVYHPPSMGYIQGLLSITGQLTSSKNKMKFQDEITDEQQTSRPQFSSQFTRTDEMEDLADKYVRSFYDSEGRVIAVYDNIFSAADLEELQQALLAQGEIMYLPHDVQPEEDVDNAQWIKSFDPEKFATSAVWRRLSQVMRHVSGNRTSWYPYDVALNIVRSADHTRIHQDCEEWEDEYTMVLYLNPDWRPEFCGETVFFEAMPGSELQRQLYGLHGGTEYQPIASVLPKYGRLAVFQGIIPHSARPPSNLFAGARYTFAVKVSLTRRIALAKRLQEVLEDCFEELSMEEEQLLEDLISGVYNHEPSFRSDEWLEQRLQDTKSEASKVRNNKKHQMESSLLTCE